MVDMSDVQGAREEHAEISRALLGRIDELPAPPAVAVKVLNLPLEELSAGEIARYIEADLSLSARTLKTANSPVYGQTRNVASLEQAIVLLGVPTLKQILLSIVINDSLLDRDSFDDPALASIWRHSLASAAAAELLCELVQPKIKSVAFAAGMMHDCGKALLYALDAEKYAAVLEEAKTSGRAILDVEKERLGVDHVYAGNLLMEVWGLPEELAAVVRDHHLPVEAFQNTDDPEQTLFSGMEYLPPLTALGDAVSHEVLQDADLSPGVCAELSSLLGISDMGLESVREVLLQRYESYAEQFDFDADVSGLLLKAMHRAKRELGRTALELRQAHDALERSEFHQRVCAQLGMALAQCISTPQALAETARTLHQELQITYAGLYRRDLASGVLDGVFLMPGEPNVEQTTVFSELDEKGRLCTSPVKAGVPEPFLHIFLRHPSRLLARPHSGHKLGVSYQEPWFIAPLPPSSHGAEYMGELIYEAPLSETGAPRVDTSLISQICALVSATVGKLDMMRQRDERAERLAKALRMIKDMHYQILQSERLAAVGQLAAGAAHEINNPLAIIYARTQLLEKAEQDPGKKKGVTQMKEQIERISSILKNLMEFARPDPPSFRPMDLNQAVEKALSLVRGALEKADIAAEVRLSGELPEIQGDPRQIEQVLLNVLINATHAMEETGGALTVETSLAPQTQEALITVTDQGPGIDKELLGKIFNPFFTTKEEGKGVGLGLSTSFGIMKSHGGSISAANAPNFPEMGACFTLRLPLNRKPGKVAPQHPAQTPALRADKASILVVDDEEHIRDILQESLQTAGYSVDVAINGQEGLKKLKKHAYQLMLLDVRMPKKSGLSLLESLNEQGLSLPVIVLTGLAGAEEIEEALSLGAASCIQKPFDIDALLQTIRETLEP